MFDFYQVLILALMGSTSAEPPAPAKIVYEAPAAECRTFDAETLIRARHEARDRLEAGDIAGAAQWLERYVTDCPHDAAAQRNLGRLYERLDRVREAARRYRTALVAAPDFLEARIDLIKIYLKSDDFDSASAEIKELSKRCDGDCRAALEKIQSDYMDRDLG
ncbi:MAG: hypothetical protein Tsb0010_14820 [Parvularculaceae bacterium]